MVLFLCAMCDVHVQENNLKWYSHLVLVKSNCFYVLWVLFMFWNFKYFKLVKGKVMKSAGIYRIRLGLDIFLEMFFLENDNFIYRFEAFHILLQKWYDFLFIVDSKFSFKRMIFALICWWDMLILFLRMDHLPWRTFRNVTFGFPYFPHHIQV